MVNFYLNVCTGWYSPSMARFDQELSVDVSMNLSASRVLENVLLGLMNS